MAPIFPGYQLLESIHTGFRTAIYRGLNESDRSTVIVKTLLAEYPSLEDITRLRHEYKILESLQIAGVVKAFGLKEYNQTLALFLEDFGGISLQEWMTHQALPLLSSLSIVIQLASTLANLHKNHIIHKDIKPHNIIINPLSGQVKIIDFSIASQLERENPTLRHPDLLEGSLAYMSPEQTGRMNRVVDYRTDFYSLGVTFYEMLTGQLPFDSRDALELVHAHIAKIPVAPHLLNPEIPPAISQIILKLLAKTAEDRYQNAEGLKFDLETCLLKLQNHPEIRNFTPGLADKAGQLLIPQKLYGREAEVATLLETFDRVSSGNTELMLVSGYSGIGKTVLVNEVHKPIVRQRGYFIAGKFDQFKRNIPFASLIQAFQSLVLQLLTESHNQIAIWKEKLLSALGNNAQVIIDVIPEIELIIGQQPPVPQLGATETQNRFSRVFKQFISVFTTQEHPLVIFLDDLQWADSASLKLIELLITDTDSQYLLLIGAYRDNEVSPTHPTVQTIERIEQAGATVNKIILSPLQLIHVEKLITDTLNESIHSKKLAELLFNKTQGNPFFLTQLFKTLYEEDLLVYNLYSATWQWSLEQIHAIGITDYNVVELIARNIRKLSPETQKVLKLAACIGNTFNLAVLSVVSEETSLVTAAQLWHALQAGLILPLSNEYKIPLVFSQEESQNIRLTDIQVDYKFLHDRVQQAAYSLIPDDQKKETHLKIGQLLLENSTPEDQKENIFALVNQLNYGTDLLIHEAEKQQLAELNLIAGQKAKSATAYESAIKYLNVGLGLLGQNSWENQYPLTLKLYVEALTTEYLNTNFERASHLSNIVLNKAQNLLETVPVYETQIQFYIAQNQMQAAIDTAIKILNFLEEPWPEMPDTPHGLIELLDPQKNLAGKSIEELVDLPEMSNPYKIAALQILIAVAPSVFVVAPHLFPLVIIKMIQLSLRYGNTSPSAYAYVLYAMNLIGVLSDFESGYKFGQLSLTLLDKMNAKEFKSKIYAVYNFFIRPWKEPASNTVEAFKEGIQAGLETGDIELVCRGSSFYCNLIFFMQQPLDQIDREQNKYFALIKKYQQKFDLDYTRIWRQGVKNLMSDSREIAALKGEFFQEEVDLDWLISTNNHMALFSYYLLKSHFNYLVKNYAIALEYALLAFQYRNSLAVMTHTAQTNFYYSLSLLALYPQVEPTKQVEYLNQVLSNQEKMKDWAFHASSNYQHKYDLVEAEKARILGRREEAIDYYEQAIRGAKAQGYLQEEALANELAAEFQLSLGREKIAKTYMTDAYYGYIRWGATAKVQDLEERYPQLIARSLPLETVIDPTATMVSLTTTGSQTDFLDLATVMKASQAISGEILLANLLDKLMKTLIENAGAEIGYFITLKSGQFLMEASGTKDAVQVLQSIPLETSGTLATLPISLLNYVARTQKDVVLNDASRSEIFNSDPYIAKQQTKSLLCMPILYQGKLTAILYLENNLVAGAFTPRRVEVLRMLSAQAAIALENAQLYHTLEIKVEERTQQLKDQNTQLEAEVKQRQVAEQRAETANRAKSQFLTNMSHELRTPLNGILGYAQILKREKNLTQQQQVGVKIINQCGEHLLTLINDILDLSKIEAGKMELYPTEFHFSEFLQTIVEVCRIRAEQKGISLIYEPLTQLPTGIYADQKRLRQVLINLLGNAVKFTEAGGVIFRVGLVNQVPEVHHNSLSCSTEDSPQTSQEPKLSMLRIRFQVEDTGVGIEPEELSKIFSPFEQVGHKAHQTEGTGLGLAISRQLIEMMNGELKVESVLGEGSIFSFELDLPEAEEWVNHQKPAEKIIRGYAGAKRKLLVVDDKWENRFFLVNLLAPVGFEIEEAKDGQECLTKAGEFQPDCILIDLVMPIMDGFEAIRRIHKSAALKNIVMIGTSASIFEPRKAGSLMAGCDGFLAKPIRADELFECLGRCMKLEWVYEVEDSHPDPALHIATESAQIEEIVPPTSEKLSILLNLAMLGDLKEIEEEAERLKGLSSQYIPFATELIHFAKEFEEEKILEFIQKYIEG